MLGPLPVSLPGESMPFDWQTTICLVCIAAAAIALGRRSWRVLRGEADNCGGCSAACGEPVSEDTKSVVSEDQISLLYQNEISRRQGVPNEK